ncbi:MAG: FtsK/SpoIIIE domain-containing protein [Actinomycetota bacterium]
MLAPILGSVVIWAITRSPFALVFALLGPLVAIASVADARIQSRRLARRESARFGRDLAATRVALRRLQSDEREQLLRAEPGAIGLRVRPIHDPERWRLAAATGVPVRLGLGRAASTGHLDGDSTARVAGEDPVQSALDQLHEEASTVDGAPIVADARLGIGVCGPRTLADAVARGILVQLGDRLPPPSTVFALGGAAERGWMESLPHRSVAEFRAGSPEESASRSPAAEATVVGWRCDGQDGVVAVAARMEGLPVECRVVVQVGAGRSARVIRAPDGAGLGLLPVALAAEFVSTEQARDLARFLAASAAVLGRQPPVSETSAQDFQSLSLPDAPSAFPGSLACVFARAEDGGDAVEVDLTLHGPHAIVGGTTGSGKSELLVSWVLAIARVHPPSAVNFLLVDFKGGASFAPIRALPHVVGLVTDLDERTAQRAMLSLRAELRFREKVIAAAGARSIDDPGVDLPRLVIMVDEFAALASDYPHLHELFADLAARGRSLGLHLVLCTQRPAGAIRDAVLANATLRLSLRVNNRADSVAVLGTAQAAELSGDTPGRAWISIGGDSARLVRVARATEEDVRRVIEMHPVSAGSIRRPWCDDLPRSVSLSSLSSRGSGSGESETGIVFALVDLPGEQRQDVARFEPSQSGSLLVIGAQGSGKSELLQTLAAASGVEMLPALPDEAWDAVEVSLSRLRSGLAGPRLLLVDDLDALVGRFPDEYRSAFIDRLGELARDGSAVGLQLGLAVRRIPPALHTLVALCDDRVILRLGSREDHLMAGGTTSGFVGDAPPGSGEWRGSRIQVARRSARAGSSTARSVSRIAPFDLSGHTTVVVVTTRMIEFSRRLRAIDPPVGEVCTLSAPGRVTASPGALAIGDAQLPRVIVGDPDGWQSNWALLSTLRADALVLVDRCSVNEFRAISGQRTLPPPIRSGADHCWALDPDGSVLRMRAPSA